MRAYWAVVLAFCLAATPALAAAFCAPREVLVETLAARHGEEPTDIGLAANGSVVEVFTTPDGATWTIIITMPNGVSCMMAAGENWEPATPAGRGT